MSSPIGDENKRFLNRTGEKRLNNQGIEMEIIKYKNKRNIDVLFNINGYIRHSTTYDVFKKGEIKNPYFPSMIGIGYIGEGKYTCSIKNKRTIQYQAWSGMFERCYKNHNIKNIRYVGCEVCEEWHNFQNFGKWFDENIWGNIPLCVDKDLFSNGFKRYSPTTCVLLDKKINSMIASISDNNIKGIRYNKKEKIYNYDFISNGEKYKLSNKNLEKLIAERNKIKKIGIIQIANEYREKYKDFPQKIYKKLIEIEVK